MATSTIEAPTGLLLLKTEATYGVDVVPDETDAFFVRDVKMEWEPAMLAKPRVGPTRQSRGKARGKVSAKLSFTLDAVGSIVSDVNGFPPPRQEPALLACEMEVTDTGTSPTITAKTYTYTSRAAQSSLTAHLVLFAQDGATHDVYDLTGVRLAPTLKGSLGDPLVFGYEGMGLFQGAPSAGSYDLSLVDFGPVGEIDDTAVMVGMTVTLGGVSQEIKSFEWSGNRTVEEREAVTSTYGVAAVHITAPPDGVQTIKFDSPLELAADQDHFTDMLNGTTAALSVICDSVGGHRLTVAGPKLQRGSFSYDEDAGILRVNQEAYLVDNTPGGDDAVSFAFTATP